jgi:integrase
MAEIKSATGGVLVVELVAAYLEYARGYYRKGDRPTGELASVIAAGKVFADVVGDKFTDQILPDDLRACQESMIARGLARSTINSHCGRILRCLSWGVAHTTATGKPFVPAGVLAVLREVERLGAHRTAAREPRKVTSVPWDVVERTLEHIHANQSRAAILTALIRTHWLTGMRSSALLAMRGEDIDRTATEWRYVVGSDANKNAHRGKELVTFIGPKAQAILSPLLATTPPGEPVFHFINERTDAPLHIDKDMYGRLVRLACKRAGVDPWHPHQLRHSRATEVQRIYESDASAAASIGDTEEVTRRVYVDPSEVVRRRIARETG